MLIEIKKHRNWMLFTFFSTLLALGYYAYYWRETMKNGGTGPSGTTVSGLAYGVIGFLMMVFCGLLGARKLVRIWRLGTARSWLRAHIWLGLLAFPMILCHSGFLFGYRLTFWLMVLFIIVEITGIIGVLLQQYIPGIMLQLVKNESTYEQIPFVIQKLKLDAGVLTSHCCGAIKGNLDPAKITEIEATKKERLKQRPPSDLVTRFGPLAPANPEEEKAAEPLLNFFLDEVEPFLSPKYLKHSKLSEVQKARAVFSHVQTLLPRKLHPALEEIQSLCEERRQLQTQSRLHRILHCWEYVHVPLSYLLLALSVFHVVIATWKYSGVLNK